MLYFVDVSGSTSGELEYWKLVDQIVPNGSKVIFWSTVVRDITVYETGYEKYWRKYGGGTDPTCFVPNIPNGSDITIITDGQIGNSEVHNCDLALAGRIINSVVIHFIGADRYMNLSVAAPFIRNTTYQLYRNGMLYNSGSTGQVDLPKFENPAVLSADMDAINKIVTLRTMGRKDETLRTELLRLRTEALHRVLELSQPDTTTDVFGDIRRLICAAGAEPLVEAAAGAAAEAAQQGDHLATAALLLGTVMEPGAATTLSARSIELEFARLIKLCDGHTNYSFDAIQPGRLARSAAVAAPNVAAGPVVEAAGAFECPVSLDLDVPTLLIAAGQPITTGLTREYLDLILNNPLMVLSNDNLVNAICARIDHCIGYNAAKALFAHGTSIVSPLTRRRVSACLVASGNHSLIACNKYALANLFFGNKIVGEHGSWLCVVYLAMSKIPYLTEYMPEFQRFLKEMLPTLTTNITLTGQAVYPYVKAPYDIAVWHCVQSVKTMNSRDDIECDRLRSFGESSRWFLEILNVLGYKYDAEWTRHRLAIYRAFAWMMHKEKYGIGNARNWRRQITDHNYNYMVCDGTIIPLDGQPVNPRPLNPSIADLDLDELHGLMQFVDKTTTVNKIKLPLTIPRRPIHAAVVNWPNYVDAIYTPVAICLRTLRPYLNDPATERPWEECAVEKHGPLDKQMSNYNNFIKFVARFKKYPTRDEFIVFLYNKYREAGITTMPITIVENVESVFDDYRAVLGADFSKVSPNDFIEITDSSCCRERRENMENY
jgi:hypothetical protein